MFELPILDQKDFDPALVDSQTQNSNKEHKIPDFEFLDQEGRVFTNKDLDGKIYIADFHLMRWNMPDHDRICSIFSKSLSMIHL